MTGLGVILLGLLALLPLTPLAPLESLAGRMGPAKGYETAVGPYTGAPLPIRGDGPDFDAQARSVLAVDLTTAQPLFEKNADEQLPIASITKLIAVMVILRDHSLTETVTIPALPAYGPADSKLGLVAGQQFTVAELLEAALVPSANDSADALAIWDSGTIEAFTVKMNDLVKTWGISGPKFASASGLNDAGNHASARDLAKLAKIALTNAEIRRLAATPQTSVSDLSGRAYQSYSTNRLLGTIGVKGLKTGYTLAAGQSFMALADIEGHEVITVVLNSPDRFAETARLIGWIERTWQWL